MKRVQFLAGIVLSLTLLRLPVCGQDSAPAAAEAPAPAAATVEVKAAAAAEQQAEDEKFKRLAADMEALRAANQMLLDKWSSLKDDLQQIRAEQARLAAGAISHDDLKPLTQKIEEVDKKRLDDKGTILEEITKVEARLVKLITNAADSPPRTPARNPVTTATTATEDGYIYTVKARDRLDDIIAAYNEEFKTKGMKTISREKVIDANLGINPNRLKIGQKIVIPHPAP
jgi:hypothetical protein